MKNFILRKAKTGLLFLFFGLIGQSGWGQCLTQANFTATPSGWIQTSVTYALNEALFSSSTGKLTTLTIANPTTLTFDLRRTTNANAKSLLIQVSTTTQVGSFTTVSTFDHSNTTSGTTSNCSVDLSAYSNSAVVYIQFVKSSSTTSPWYLKNIVVNCVSIPSLNQPTVSTITTTSATLGATVTSNGGAALSARGTVWGTSASPTGNSLAEGNTTVAAFTHSRTGLTANTLYYFRGYAENSAGTGYSADGTFTTLPLAPTVGTGNSITSSGFTANWSHPTMGSASYTYTVEVDDDNAFGSINSTVSSIASSNISQAITGLAASTTYYYRVKAVNAQGSSVWSSTSAGVTTSASASPLISCSPLTAFGSVCINITTAPNSFTITGASLTAANVTVASLSGYTFSITSGGTYTSTLSLTQSGGAYSQEIFVKFTPTSAASFSGNIVVGGGGASDVNVAASGTGISGIVTVTTTTASSITTTAASTGGSSVSTTCGTITAKGVAYGTSANPTTPTTSNGTGTENFSSSLSGLTPNTLYNYRVYATNSNGVTNYGSNLTFTTLHNAPNIGLGSGATQSAINANWTAPTSGGPATFTYEVAISTAADFSSTLLSQSSISSATLTYQFTGLTGGTTYYFRARAVNAGGNSAWSSISTGYATLSDAISLTALGTAATENFNTLANTSTSSVMPTGWFFSESGSSANSTYSAGTGSGTGGDTYSFGLASNNERALGGLQSGTLIPIVGAKFANNTGATINNLFISYTGETWRVGTFSRIDRLDFQYSIDATSLTTGTWIDFDALDYANPGQATGSGFLQHSYAISDVITSLTIANGATFWIRCTDFNATGADDGMGIDDFSIKPCGEVSAPTASAQSFCSATSPTVASLVATGTAVQWYSASTGGSSLSTSTALSSQSYYASQTVSGCESTTRTSVAITVNTNPTAPNASAQSFCSANSPTVASLVATGTAIKWYDASSNGNLLASNSALTTGTYYASQTVSGCESTSRTAATVSLINSGTWTGGSSSWSSAANWCGGIPTASTNVVISSGSPILDVNHTIASGSSLTLSGTATLTINPDSILTITGTADFGGKSVTLKSDSSGTAAIGQVTGSLSGATNVTVERYIPAKRAWRALTAPLKGSNTSLYASWQNAGATPVSPFNTGVELWGPSGTGLASGAGYSIRQYTSSGWADVTNTQSANLFTTTANTAYLVFVTGGYGSANIGNGLSAATTLKATGELITGPVSFAVTSARHTLVGNPFASPISPSAILAGNTQANLYTNIWMWDPAVSTNGTFVNYDASINSGTFSDNSGSYTTSSTAIQSGQAFFVRAVANTDTLTLTEQMKSSSISNTFRNSNNITASVVRVGFAKQTGTEWMPLDGAIAALYNNANAAVDVADGTKMVNTSENLAFVRGTTNLSIEHYPIVNATDQLNVKIWNTQQAHYKLKLNTEEYTMVGVEAWLQDLYTGTSQPLNLDGSMQEYEFDVDPTVSASSGNRFRIVFTNTALAVDTPTQGQLSIYPNPATGSKVTVSLPTGNFEGCSYELINVLGQVVRQDEINNSTSSQVSIPITGLPNSWYALRILKDTSVLFQGKLIIKN